MVGLNLWQPDYSEQEHPKKVTLNHEVLLVPSIHGLPFFYIYMRQVQMVSLGRPHMMEECIIKPKWIFLVEPKCDVFNYSCLITYLRHVFVVKGNNVVYL